MLASAATGIASRQFSVMTSHADIKPDARQLVERLDDSATWDDERIANGEFCKPAKVAIRAPELRHPVMDT